MWNFLHPIHFKAPYTNWGSHLQGQVENPSLDLPFILLMPQFAGLFYVNLIFIVAFSFFFHKNIETSFSLDV